MPCYTPCTATVITTMGVVDQGFDYHQWLVCFKTDPPACVASLVINPHGTSEPWQLGPLGTQHGAEVVPAWVVATRTKAGTKAPFPCSLHRIAAPAPCTLLTSMDGSSSCSSGSSGPWLPTALQLHILSLLPPNDRALSCRLVSPDAAGSLSGPGDNTASLSQPLPPHAVPWALEAGQQHVRQLPFLHKLQLLCTAAASGSEVNLEVALALLQPSIFPELLQSYTYDVVPRDACPGRAAATAGHPQLLHWLVRRCPGFMWPEAVLEAAARHCDLAGLHFAWEALQHGLGSSSLSHKLSRAVLDAAAESSTPDAVAKMEWVLRAATGAGGGGCRLHLSTAAAAAGSGDLGRLQWLRDRGCPMGCATGPVPLGEPHVVEAALRHADLAMAQWLVDEAGYELPAASVNADAAEGRDQRVQAWTDLMRAAAKGSNAVSKWQWLQQRGGPSVSGADGGLVKELTVAAVRAGQVEALKYLLSVLGPSKVLAVGRDALSEAAGDSGCIPVAECLQQAGLVFSREAWIGAAGTLPFFRWLALEAGSSAAAECDTEGLSIIIESWPESTPAHSRDLLEAVQLLVGARYSDWDRELDIVDYAASLGHLDLVRYLLSHDWQFEPKIGTIASAADAGCEPLLELLVGMPNSFTPSEYFEGVSPYVAAAVNGDQATLDALWRLGVPWCEEDMVAQAVTHNSEESALRWLVEHGAPVGSAEDMEEAVAGAVQRGVLSAEAAAWLRGLAAGGSGAGVSDGEE